MFKSILTSGLDAFGLTPEFSPEWDFNYVAEGDQSQKQPINVSKSTARVAEGRTAAAHEHPKEASCLSGVIPKGKRLLM